MWKKYANEVSAKEHVSIDHLKEDPYECQVCHKKFSRAAKFSNHKTTVHPGVKFKKKVWLEMDIKYEDGDEED